MVKEKVKERSIKNVKLIGFKSGDDLKKLLSEATCTIVPSVWYENCPMTVLESFASGRPVIGSKIGGIPELINNRKDGLVFKTGNAEDLSQKVKWIWENRSEAKEMGMRGRKKVEEKFNAEKHYEGLMAVYNSVLDK